MMRDVMGKDEEKERYFFSGEKLEQMLPMQTNRSNWKLHWIGFGVPKKKRRRRMMMRSQVSKEEETMSTNSFMSNLTYGSHLFTDRRPHIYDIRHQNTLFSYSTRTFVHPTATSTVLLHVSNIE